MYIYMYMYIYRIVVRTNKICLTKNIISINCQIHDYNFFRLVTSVTLNIIIDDWMECKRVNNSLPADKRKKIEGSIDDLRLPCFQSSAIGALHKAGEAFLVCKYTYNISFNLIIIIFLFIKLFST